MQLRHPVVVVTIVTSLASCTADSDLGDPNGLDVRVVNSCDHPVPVVIDPDADADAHEDDLPRLAWTPPGLLVPGQDAVTIKDALPPLAGRPYPGDADLLMARLGGTIAAIGIPPGSSEPARVVVPQLACD
jgi:hypothetical protein